MNFDEAVKLLMTSKDVHDWNDKRDQVKPFMSQTEMYEIDGKGLIHKALNKNTTN